MTDVPKIVHNRLRAAEPPPQTQAHPDADLLIGLAEQALSISERNGVLEHLALCGDCRDAVILALPAETAVALSPMETEADRATLIPAKTNNSWLNLGTFAWPTLRWAALATGVAVAASVLLLHPGKLNQAARPPEQTSATTLAPRIADSQTSPSSTDRLATLAKPDTNTPDTNTVVNTTNAVVNTNGRQEAVVTRNKTAVNSLKAPPDVLIANNKLPNNKKQSSDTYKTRAQWPAAPVANQPSTAIQSTAIQSMDETVEVSAASPNVLTSSPENTLMARNEAPAIEKAKPVPQEIETEATALQTSTAAPPSEAAMVQTRKMIAGTLPVSRDLFRNVTWAIAAGVLQRSLDSGQTWQNALHGDRPLLCYANLNEDLWTGGEKGELFHSTDSGLTWVRVQPSANAQQLSGDITHIDVRGVDPQRNPRATKEIVVKTSTNEVWSSLDSGTTWTKN